MRLIDADALPRYTGYALSANEIAKAVENAPTIEAEPVRYCRECKWSRCHINVDKHGKSETYWRCLNWDGGTDEEGYCYEWEAKMEEQG